MQVKYEIDGEIAIITLENGSVNPITPQMHREMLRILQDIEQNSSIKVGILTGSGDRAFCAGDDIKSDRPVLSEEEQVYRHFFGRVSPDDKTYPSYERDVHTFRRSTPIIAAVNGWCLGGGMFYLLHLTDIRVAGLGARFGLPEIKYGMAGASGLTQIYRHLPRAVAMKLLLTGDPIDSQEALRVNLVNEVVPSENVVARAREIAARICRHPALSIHAEMEIYRRCEEMGSEHAYALADHIYRLQVIANRAENHPVAHKAQAG